MRQAAMFKGSTLVKKLLAILLPVVLIGLLAFQVLRCRNILNRRNSYLLENLPVSTDWAWDALSGNVYPYLYAEDDQPGGIFRNSLSLSLHDSFNDKSALSELKSKWLLDIYNHQKDFRDSVLIPGLPSLSVHYLWCADAYFEMGHYITILSALHQFRPDKMIIHYLVKPRTDPHGYWRWLEDLERDVVTLVLKPLRNPRHCSYEMSAGVEDDDFPDAHGVFLLGDVTITNLTRPDVIRLMAESFIGKEADEVQVNEIAEEKWGNSQLFVVSNTEPYHLSQSPGRAVLTCSTESDFNNAINLIETPCVSMQSPVNFDELLHHDTRFLRYARTLLYGSPSPLHFQARQETKIPNTFHIILQEETLALSPLQYVSIKSAFKNGKVDTVYVHGKREPKGELWDRLIEVDYLNPRFIPFGSFLESNQRHASLTYMLYTLVQHGGIASFGDAIFVKRLSSESGGAVASLHRSQYRQKHRTLNTAVLAAVPGSEFIRSLLGTIHQSDNSWPNVEPDDLATHLSEVYPHSVHIDSQLTSHQDCEGSQCQVAGGHDLPQMVSTTRFIWQHGEPKTLSQLLAVQGPFAREMRLIG